MDKKELEKIKEITEEPNLRKKMKKIRKHLRKYDSLRKVILNPEEEVAEANMLDAKNLYKLLVFLRDIYPIGSSFKQIKEKMNLNIFLEHQLEPLRIDHLIMKRDFVVDEEFKKNINPEFLKGFPEYVITTKGMEFVNSIEVRDLTKKIKKLTRILLGFGAITLIFIANQLIFQILQYYK